MDKQTTSQSTGLLCGQIVKILNWIVGTFFLQEEGASWHLLNVLSIPTVVEHHLHVWFQVYVHLFCVIRHTA